jgi:hypothetical protein
MPSTGASTDGFGRQFGIVRGGDASRQLIGYVEALCQSIDPGRVFIGKSLHGRGSPRRFAEQVQCLHLPDVRSAYRLDRPGPVIWRERVPETIRFKYRAFLSYSHPDTRNTDMNGLQAELEAAFRKLPIAPPDEGGIPYEWLIPGIGRQLALMKPVDRKVASPDATKRRLVALKKHNRASYRNCARGRSKAPATGWQGRASKKSGNAGCADCGGALLWPDGHEADPHHAAGRRQSPWSISRSFSQQFTEF